MRPASIFSIIQLSNSRAIFEKQGINQGDSLLFFICFRMFQNHLHIDFLICICYNASRRKEIASPCRQKE